MRLPKAIWVHWVPKEVGGGGVKQYVVTPAVLAPPVQIQRSQKSYLTPAHGTTVAGAKGKKDFQFLESCSQRHSKKETFSKALKKFSGVNVSCKRLCDT